MGLFDFLSEIPIVGGLFDDSNANAEEQYRKAIEIMQQADPRSPEYQQIFREFNPDMYSATTVTEDPSLRSGQIDYLSKLAGLADMGLSPQDELNLDMLRDASAAAESSATQNALRDARARGVSGGGMEFALRQGLGQNQAQNARSAALNKASQEANQRAMYTKAYGDALGQVRSNDFTVGSKNADIMNKFNELNTGLSNQAKLWNEVEGQNKIKQANYNNMSGWAGNMSNVYGQSGDNYMNQNQRRRDARGDNLNTLGAGLDLVGVDPADWFRKKEEPKSTYSGYNPYGPAY